MVFDLRIVILCRPLGCIKLLPSLWLDGKLASKSSEIRKNPPMMFKNQMMTLVVF